MKTPDEIKKGLEWDEIDEALRKVRLADAGEDDMWKPKTSDDIKQGLQCCSEDGCVGCPYEQECREADGFTEIAKDTLAYIQQKEQENAEQAERIRVLESRNNALYHTLLGVMHFVDKWLDCPAYDPDEDLKGTAAVGRAAHAREIALQAIEQLEAERDAAVEDMTKIVHESSESYCEYCHNWRGNTCPPYCRTHSEGFRWRGVQKEE